MILYLLHVDNNAIKQKYSHYGALQLNLALVTQKVNKSSGGCDLKARILDINAVTKCPVNFTVP